MRIERFMHAKLDVRDLAASEAFYRDLLGLEELVRYTTDKGFIVQYSPGGAGAGVELWFERDREVAEATEIHVAFAVDDTRSWVEFLRQRGVEVAEEPFEIGGEVIAFVRDPDGYLVELNQS